MVTYEILTKRECQVLELIVKGMRNKDIACSLCISENTVEQHLRHIYQKLNMSSRVEASVWFLKATLEK